MQRFLMILLAGLASFLAGCGPRAVAPGEEVRVGRLAPDFEGPTLDGGVARLSDYRGRYVLVDFWGTWCPPCLGEVPHLKAAYAAYNRNRFDILAIATNDTPEQLWAFIEREGLPWTQVLQHELDPARRTILELYRITGYPSTFLIDPNGVVVARGAVLRSSNLAITLAKYVGPPA